MHDLLRDLEILFHIIQQIKPKPKYHQPVILEH